MALPEPLVEEPRAHIAISVAKKGTDSYIFTRVSEEGEPPSRRSTRHDHVDLAHAAADATCCPAQPVRWSARSKYRVSKPSSSQP